MLNRNFTFFYDGDLLEYQVGTKRLVKAIINGDQFVIKKNGKEYKGQKARALFKTDKEFKLWKRTIDGEQNAIIQDACLCPRIRVEPDLCMERAPDVQRSTRSARSGTDVLCAVLRVRGDPRQVHGLEADRIE